MVYHLRLGRLRNRYDFLLMEKFARVKLLPFRCIEQLRSVRQITLKILALEYIDRLNN